MSYIARDCRNAGADEMSDILAMPVKFNRREDEIRKRYANRPDQRQRNKVDDDEALAFGGDTRSGAAEDEHSE